MLLFKLFRNNRPKEHNDSAADGEIGDIAGDGDEFGRFFSRFVAKEHLLGHAVAKREQDRGYEDHYDCYCENQSFLGLILEAEDAVEKPDEEAERDVADEYPKSHIEGPTESLLVGSKENGEDRYDASYDKAAAH